MRSKPGRHRAAKQKRLPSYFTTGLRRKLLFGTVGISTMVIGYITLFVTVDILHWNKSVGYAVQAAVAIESNLLLNYSLTWRDRKKSFWSVLWRFHVSRAFTVPFNQALFNILIALGVQYMVANTACILAVTVINWFVGDRFTFRSKRTPRRTRGQGSESLKFESQPLPLDEVPRMSVVIPTKNGGDRTAQTVDRLLAQRYPHPLEIVVVGDMDDSVWPHLDQFGDWIVRIGVDVDSVGRDSNAKRSIGLRNTSEDSGILAVMDDDVLPDSIWAWRVMSHLAIGKTQGFAAVAGPVTGIGDSFWTRYIDHNPVAAKMPRIGLDGYLLNQSALKRYKFPVTANFAFTRALYEAVGGPNPAFVYSYEDYSWMSLITQKGYSILCTPSAACERHHREGLRPLIREYLRSGKGCADFIRAYGKCCTFAGKRLRQLYVFYALILLGGALVGFAPAAAIPGGILLTFLLMALVAVKIRRLEATLYPLISLLLGSMFIVGLSSRLALRRRLIAPTIREAAFLDWLKSSPVTPSTHAEGA